MKSVFRWFAKAGRRLVRPITNAQAVIKVFSTADVFSLTLLRSLLVGSTLLILLANSSACAAPCQGQIGQDTNVIGESQYDPFSPVPITDAFQIPIRNMGDDACSYALVFRSEKPDLRLSGSGTLAYTLTNGRSKLVALPDQTVNPPLARTKRPLAPADTGHIRYQVQIPRGQFAAPGTYHDTIGLELYALNSDGGLSGPPLHNSKLTISYKVIRAMSVNIKGGGTSTTVNFGALSTGQQRSVEIQARSNETYQFHVSSDNRGAMRLTPPAPERKWRVNYRAALDGKTLDLASGHVLHSQPPTRPGNDANHRLTVTVGDTAAKRAGHYEDIITVEIRGATL
ncbi:MAG: hypothetical protein P8Y47_00190 [Alphaproteobacteria bacterium]